MDVSARQSCLYLSAGGGGFAVLGVTGHEALNRPFLFEVTVLAAQGLAPPDLIGTPARLEMTAADGYARRVNGVITRARVVAEAPGGQLVAEVTVASVLSTLALRRDSRLILSQTLPEILQQTLCRNAVPASTLHFHWSRDYPLRPSTLQADEDDLAFVLRHVNRQGLLLWSEARDSDEILHIADSTNACPRLPREVLAYRAPGGLETTAEGGTHVGILDLTARAAVSAASYQVHDVQETAPGQPLLAERLRDEAGPAVRATRQVRFGDGVQSNDEAAQLALVQAQRAAAKGLTLHLSSHAADLQVGAIIAIDADAWGSGISGDYLITAIDHEARQFGGLGLGGETDCPYTNRVTLTPRERPWRPEEAATPALPLTFTARIESPEQTPLLDAAGRYRYKQHPDSNATAKGEGSASIRRLQPYGSPAGALPVGWHLPLHDGNEVLISCLNNDPDRPMIVGTLPNPQNPSPVTDKNPHENRLRTKADNELCLDDLRDKEAITLRTFMGHNILHLSADVAGHRINLASAQGRLEAFAHKTMRLECDDSCTETVGNDRTHIVENAHRTTTNSKEIHYQAATDGQMRAGKGIQLDSGKNLELRAEKDIRLDITEATRITVDGGDGIITVDSGTLTLQADKGIRIQGDGGGDITLGQNGGGIKIAPNGDVTLFGNAVDLSADGGISFNGKTYQTIASPPAVQLPEAMAPLEVAAIAELAAEKKSGEKVVEEVAFQLVLEDLFQPKDEAAHKLLVPFYEGARCLICTDNGDTLESTVQGGIVTLPEFVARQRFQVMIEGFDVMEIVREGTTNG